MGVARPLRGEVRIPGDKSISHRGVLFGALANGTSRFRTEVLGRDNLGSIRVMSQLGLDVRSKLTPRMFALAQSENLPNIERTDGPQCEIVVRGSGIENLKSPLGELYCGNSGTTARLLTGLLAGSNVTATLTGDESLTRRPFQRVTEPLAQMGAKFSGNNLPLTVQGALTTGVRGINYHSPKASAQVKSAILLAGLSSQEEVVVSEPTQSRDHTERLLQAMGCPVTCRDVNGKHVVTLPEASKRQNLQTYDFEVPGDFSAAAFFLVAGSIIQGSEILVKNVGINPTRIGLMTLLRRMSAKIEEQNHRTIGGEQVVDLLVQESDLVGIEVTPEDVVLAIDEIPVLCVAAAVAKGKTTVRGAQELRVKESDRLHMSAEILRAFDVQVEEFPDGLEIEGRPELRGEKRVPSVTTYRKTGDHRIAMCGAIAEYLAGGALQLEDEEAVETSFPTFLDGFSSLIAN